jgi:hypothetical protein
MRHSAVTEDRLRIKALAIKTREKGRRGRAIETTIMETETDLFGIRQKILASGSERKIHLAKPFKMDVRMLIVKRKGDLAGSHRAPETCNFYQQ